MLSDIEAREALHVLVLKRLGEQVRPGSFALKGGVNLRLYFKSVRYSEDMDLDLEPEAKVKVTAQLSKIAKDAWLETRLRALGLQGVEYAGRPHKNTDTTVRVKLAVITAAGIRLHTKIDMSLRGPTPGDVAVDEAADSEIVGKYVPAVEGSLVVAHYPVGAAIRQKIAALALRTAPEARDVFDTHVLARGDLASVDIESLAKGLPRDILDAALGRVWALGYAEFSDQVREYLPEEVRDAVGSEDEWASRQLFAAELIERVKSCVSD